MNDQQALREARRRWGPKAAIQKRKEERTVGYVVMGLMFCVEGQGKTWALAFAQCDRKKVCSEVFRAAEGQPCPRCARTIQSSHWARAVHDPEQDPPTLDDVVCRSCWLNIKLPPELHRLSEDRRFGIYRLGMHLGQWVECLARGDVVGFRRLNRALPPYVEGALLGNDHYLKKHQARVRKQATARWARERKAAAK